MANLPSDHSTILLGVCAIVLLTVPMYFIWNAVYKDGVLGRLSLSGVSLSAFVVLTDILDGSEYEMAPSMMLMVLAFTVFLVWHLWRFHRRVLKRAEKTERLGDVPDRRLV